MLRVVVAVGAGVLPVLQSSAGPGQLTWTSAIIGLVSGMLIAGLLTPLSSLALAALGLANAAGLGPFATSAADGLLAPAMALAVVLLGPGAYSLDARLFGRREIVVSHAPRR